MTQLKDKTVVIGLGSPIMTDDAVGLKVSEMVESLNLPDVDTRQEAIGGLDILPMIRGYRFAIVVDAIQTYMYDPGTIMLFDPEDFDSTIADASAHDVNLATAIKIGRDMDPDLMPEKIRFVAIEVKDIQTMSETMNPEIEECVDSAKNAILHIISEFRCPDSCNRTS